MNPVEIDGKMLFFKVFTHNGAQKIEFSVSTSLGATLRKKEYLSKNNSAFYMKKLYFSAFSDASSEIIKKSVFLSTQRRIGAF